MKKNILTICLFFLTLSLYGQNFTKITSDNIVNDGGGSQASCWGDYDNDGYLDLFVTNVNLQNNFLYNNNGDGTFTKITSSVIVSDSANSGGSSWGDYNNDGYIDLFVPNWDYYNNFLYQNNGDGSFNKITNGEIVNDGVKSGSCSWADFDNDGNLDMLVINDGNNYLYRNIGDGTFMRITSGVVVSEGGSNMGSWGDYDNDGYLDLFVANYGNNYLYKNNGDGTFIKNTSSIIVSENETSHGGSWGDYDNDGDLDLFITNMNENNILYRNNGDGTFYKITTGLIVNDGGWSHAGSWGDYDNDGDLDLFVSNSGNENNFLYWNNGDGTFNKDLSGIIVNDSGWTWASVSGDYDKDGDLDIFVTDYENNNNSLYQNDGNGNNWINIKCIGILSNRSAIGAKVSIKAIINGNPVWQLREVSGLTSFHSQNSLNIHFGLADASIIDSILIKWPSGIKQFLTNVNVNQFLNIVESTPVPILISPNDNSTGIPLNPTLEWNSVPGTAQYRVQVAYDTAFSNVHYDDSGQFTSIQIPWLYPGYIYYWRVNSTDSSFITSDWSEIWSFTTEPGSTNLVEPVDGATGILLTPMLIWNDVPWAAGYEVQIATDINFTNIVEQQTSIVDTILQVFGLNMESNYFWHVRVSDGPSISNWSDTWSFTTMVFPILTTQNANPVNDVSAQLNAMVNPNNLKIGIGFEYGETTSYGYYVQTTPDTLSNASASPVSAIIGGLYTDRDYHFRVVANSPDGSIYVYGDDQVFHTASYPTSMDFSSPTMQFPHHNDLSLYAPQDYRIIGVPGGMISKNFADIIPGAHGADWQAYHDSGVESGNPEDYLIEFNGGSEFYFGEGRAYWIIYKGDLIIEEQGVSTIGLNAYEEAEIQLHPGWNLITNPFDRPIEWWKIQQSNTTIGPIFHYDGTDNWPNSDYHFTNFEPFIGYYVFTQNGMTLRIPYGATSQSASSRLSDHIWKMEISLSVNKQDISSTKMGVSEQASKNLDELDYRKPRTMGPIPSVYFSRLEWDERYTVFACDMRPEIQDVEKWDFTVSSSLNQKTTISFSGIEDVPAKHEVYLLDEIHSVYVNLREKSEYSFVPVTNITNFSVLVGNKESIIEELDKIIPTEFELGKNFPNPFNPSTLIPVSIPNESELTLKVYNVLGQEINTIFRGTKETGKHYFKWDGTNYLNQQVAAGIYLYRLNTNQGHSFVGKMVLVK